MEDKHPDFDLVHYAPEDYSKWEDVNNIIPYLEREDVATLAQAKHLLNLRDAKGTFPIHRAVERNDYRAVRSIIRLDGNLEYTDEAGRTPMFYAVAIGSKEILTLLVSKGCNIAAVDAEGNTPLHVAAESCQPSMVHFLLERFSPDVCDNMFWTPLHKASWVGCAEAVRILLDRGSNRNAMTDTKLTPLVMAIGRGHLMVADLLLRRGASANLRPENGWTALHRAAAQCDDSAVKLLLHHGADMYIIDNWGRTPMELAIERNCPEVVHLLAMKGYRMPKQRETVTDQ